MKTIRAFFAIVPPKETCSRLLRLMKSLQHEIPENDLRWISIENLHITLKFLGQLHIEHIAALSEKVSNELMNIQRFQLELGGIEWFPTLSHPKILSLVVGPHNVLMKLASIIAQSANAFNYTIESRPFRAHMTLGRIRHFNKEKDSLLQIKLIKIPPVMIDKVYLFESKLDHGKVIYSPLAQFKIGIEC